MSLYTRAGRAKVGDRDVLAFAVLVLYRITLDLSYCAAVSPAFSYSGFSIDFAFNDYCLSWACFLLCYLMLPKSNSKLSSLILQMLLLIMVTPFCSFFGLSDHAFNEETNLFFLMMSACFIFTCLFSRLGRTGSLRLVNDTKPIIKMILAIVVVGIVVFLGVTSGFHFSALTLSSSEMYEIREDQDLGLSGITNYIFSWCYHIFCPYLIADAFFSKRYKESAFWVCMQIAMYLITPHKEILFTPVLFFAVVFLMRKYKFLISFSICFALLNIAAVLLYVFFESTFILNNYSLRLLFVPAQIDFEYHDYFSQMGFLMYSDTSFGFLFGSTYPFGELTPGNIIALFYQGVVSNSNTGYLSAAYANGGYIAMFVESLLLGLILILLDALSQKDSVTPLFALGVNSWWNLINIPLSSALLTGGILIILFLAYFGGASFWKYHLRPQGHISYEEKRQLLQ